MPDFDNNKIENDINKLDKDSRKDLFNKFVEHGGEAVDKKKKPNKVKFNREKQREYLKIQEKRKEDLKKKYSTSQYGKKKSKTSSTQTQKGIKKVHKENPYEGIGKIGLYFSSLFARIRTFSGGFLSNTFIKMFKDTAQSKFLDLNLVVTTVIHSRSMMQGALKKDLILKYPLYYELLLRMDKMYDDKIFVEFQNRTGTTGTKKVKFKEVKDLIQPVFKKLYLLQPNKSDLIDALGTAFGLMQKHEKISRSAVNDHISKARSAINFLFGTFFDKVFLSWLNCINSNFSVNNPIIPKLLKLKEEDYVGYIVKKIKEELKKRQKENIEEDEKEEVIEETGEDDEKEDVNLPVEIQNGIDLIRQINFSKDRFTKDHPAFYFEVNDKIYRIYLILEEFESQYSFVLTSNKIKYVVDYNQGGRLDPKTEFNELYVQLNTVHDVIREYMNIIKEAFEIENKPGVPMMQKHNQLHNLSIRQSKTNMSIRIKLQDILKRIIKVIDEVYEKSELVVQNLDEKLSFNNSLEGRKKLDKVLTSDAIRMTMEFLKAFLYKLDKGNLSGAGIYVQ